MRVYTIVPTDQSDVVMVTVFPGNDVCRMAYATYNPVESLISRAETAAWFRYWRRCGWTITRII